MNATAMRSSPGASGSKLTCTPRERILTKRWHPPRPDAAMWRGHAPCCRAGSGAWGLPYIHLGAVALKENFEASKPMFRTFGERVAQKAKELFEPGK